MERDQGAGKECYSQRRKCVEALALTGKLSANLDRTMVSPSVAPIVTERRLQKSLIIVQSKFVIELVLRTFSKASPPVLVPASRRLDSDCRSDGTRRWYCFAKPENARAFGDDLVAGSLPLWIARESECASQGRAGLRGEAPPVMPTSRARRSTTTPVRHRPRSISHCCFSAPIGWRAAPPSDRGTV
jgi:hypothetical protein